MNKFDLNSNNFIIFYRICKASIAAVILSIVLSIALYFLVEFSAGDEAILEFGIAPSIYKGQDLILKNSSVFFYNLSGLVFSKNAVIQILVFLYGAALILGFRRKNSVYFKKMKIILGLTVYLFYFFAVYLGLGPVSDSGIKSGAVYRGDYVGGVVANTILGPSTNIFLFGYILFYCLNFVNSDKKVGGDKL